MFKKQNISAEEIHLEESKTNVHSFSPISSIYKTPVAVQNDLPEILFISSYPPRECGIATYTQDLLKALKFKFQNSFSLKVCALETGEMEHNYPEEVVCTLQTDQPTKYAALVGQINHNERIQLIIIQHEFGFFQQTNEDVFLQFLYGFSKPVVLVFHTILPNPDVDLQVKVRRMAAATSAVIVMTQNAAQILIKEYGVQSSKIEVIPHGTHLVPHLDKSTLKSKYALTGRKVLSTFGLLNSGKGIETTLRALPKVIESHPEVVFLAIGKTHPGVLQSEGEAYRDMLFKTAQELQLENHIVFVNQYLPLDVLLEYLQLTDIYLFTSKDPNQAVSGTFSYAMSCGCPVISTPMPHAREVLSDETGMIVDFQNSEQLADCINLLLGDDQLRVSINANALQKMIPTAWENAAIAHATLLQRLVGFRFSATKNEDLTFKPLIQRSEKINLKYRLPVINLDHLKKMTTEVGMIQFSKINQPDLSSGYTLDDNARAMITLCMHYDQTRDPLDLPLILQYLNFIQYCQMEDGEFLNYIDAALQFTSQNNETNLSDANGRAIWALGYLISKQTMLPAEWIQLAEEILQKAIPRIEEKHSTRSMAFAIKGLYYSNLHQPTSDKTDLIQKLANRLLQMYRHEAEHGWLWFESYLTYANSILPEAMLFAWLETGIQAYKEAAKESFDFLLSRTFNTEGIKVISNKTWLTKGGQSSQYGEQPIDVAYTILSLDVFYTVFEEEEYRKAMETAFNWFLGKNHLNQIVYNPCTGGCFDGLEEHHVNLNQGAESTLSYLMARLTIASYI